MASQGVGNAPLLIIAQSARMLAQAARNAGFAPYVLDCYADSDTRQLAVDYQQLADLNINTINSAIDLAGFKNLPGLKSALIYGSGFEYYPQSLIELEKQFCVLGNSAKIFQAVYDKPNFFNTLDKLNICHPETCFELPNSLESWLVKPLIGQGGLGIDRAENKSDEAGIYWQRYIKGTPMSVLFLANGDAAQIVGFNQQLTAENDFLFAGIISQAELSVKQKQQLERWVQQLTKYYQLRGLNSLDFIYADGECWVLEINPRPSASMTLYDNQLLAAHIHACQGKPLPVPLENSPCRGYQIIYAPRHLIMPEDIEYPEWVADLPVTGSTIYPGLPICSIQAEGDNPQQVLNRLQRRRDFIQHFLANSRLAVL